MKTKTTLSVGMKIFIAVEVLLMAAAAVTTIVWIVVSPLWKSSVLDGVFFTFVIVSIVGLAEWLFTEMILDIIKENKR